MIPQDIFTRGQFEREQILTASLINLSYEEGFPAFEDGQPIWSQMPFETNDAFRAFKKYVELGDQEGVRMVEQVSIELGQTLPLLMDYFHLYYWKVRAKAYDLYIAVVYDRRRANRLMKAEDKHYVMAEKLLQQCVDYFGALDWEGIDPGVVARMIPALVEIERRSLGAPTIGGGDAPRPQSVEILLRQMSKGDGASPEQLGVQRTNALDILISNPDAAAAAQELIIKLGG